MFYKLFACSMLLFFSSLTMHIGKEVEPIFCDWCKDLDTECLEEIFKNDSDNLLVNEEYENGKGVTVFTTFAPAAKRKILRVNNHSVAFLIYLLLDQNKLNKKFCDGDIALVLMGVHPDERKKKYGSMVMDYLIKCSLNLKAEKIWLSVKNNNTAAQVLYKKFGFLSTGIDSWNTESKWWSAYIFNNEINKRALYDHLIEQNNCDITLNFL